MAAKEFKDMTREELLDALALSRLNAEIAWRIAGNLAKQKLVDDKRYLPRFVK